MPAGALSCVTGGQAEDILHSDQLCCQKKVKNHRPYTTYKRQVEYTKTILLLMISTLFLR